MSVHVIDVRPEAPKWTARCGQPLDSFAVGAADAAAATCARCLDLTPKAKQ